MYENKGEVLLVRAEPLGLAEEVSQKMVKTRVVDGALLLDADPAWAWAINTVLVKKGLRVSELRRGRISEEPKVFPSNSAGRGTDPTLGGCCGSQFRCSSSAIGIPST